MSRQKLPSALAMRGILPEHHRFLQGVEETLDNGVLAPSGGSEVTGGFTFEPYDHGTVSSGSITPNPSQCLKQTVTNNGAFTLNATTECGDVELHVTNGASAGTITFSGFVKKYTSDPITTTNTHKFIIMIFGWGALGADYVIKARQ